MTSISTGNVASEASVSLTEMRSMTARALAKREEGVDELSIAEAEQQPHLGEIVGGAAHDLARRHLAVERGPERVQPIEQHARGARTRRRARR